ncbi:MAG: hypothetical protein Q7R67_01725 [bacterium]|nr:hypothetical protein [bacterium]
MNIAVLLPFDLIFSGNHHSTSSTAQEATEGLRVVSGLLWVASLDHYLLNFIKEFLVD